MTSSSLYDNTSVSLRHSSKTKHGNQTCEASCKQPGVLGNREQVGDARVIQQLILQSEPHHKGKNLVFQHLRPAKQRIGP
jgi:hypothetical protein